MYPSIKRMISALAVVLSSQGIAHAKIPTVNLGGYLNTQFAYAPQKSVFDVDANNHKKNNYGISNETKIDIKVAGESHGFKYGALIELNADTSPTKHFETSTARQTMLYIESGMGKFEMGNYWGPPVTLGVNAATLAVATGGIASWADWFFYFNYVVGKGDHILAATLPTEVDGAYSLHASRVTYYTPVIGNTHNNIQAGLSYVPDTDQHGTITNLKALTKSYSTNSYYLGFPAGQLFGYTNVLQGGVVYSTKFGDIDFKASASGEMGKAKNLFNIASAGETIKRHDLRSYEIGAKIQYKAFGIGGSFGDWAKSGMYKSIINTAGVTQGISNVRSGQFWDVGVSYTQGAGRASVGYVSTRNGGFGPKPLFGNPTYSTQKSKDSVLSFGIDYALAPGFMPYAEATFVSVHDKSQTGALAKNTGSIFLAGSYLRF